MLGLSTIRRWLSGEPESPPRSLAAIHDVQDRLDRSLRRFSEATEAEEASELKEASDHLQSVSMDLLRKRREALHQRNH